MGLCSRLDVATCYPMRTMREYSWQLLFRCPPGKHVRVMWERMPPGYRFMKLVYITCPLCFPLLVPETLSTMQSYFPPPARLPGTHPPPVVPSSCHHQEVWGLGFGVGDSLTPKQPFVLRAYPPYESTSISELRMFLRTIRSRHAFRHFGPKPDISKSRFPNVWRKSSTQQTTSLQLQRPKPEVTIDH